ncbi:MAG: hypothetical protein EOM85_03960, partial [Candidatus Moranbacteria bacterium]|nr:hypothetical protein [Candidatus Moranbacteria bacterium]
MKKEFKSRHEGYKIIVTYHPNKDSDFFVRAHAVDRNYDRVDKCKDVKRRVNNKEGLETIIIFARNSVETQLDHIFRAKKPQTVGEELVETPFNIAFNKVQNLDSSFFPWAETYKKNVLTYSRRNIVPWFAKNVEDRFTMIESQDLQEFLAEKIKKHGNFRGTHEDALAGAAIHLNAFKETYSLMQSIDSGLPDISFNVFTKNTRYRVEQPKSISPECHLAFRHNVEKHIDTDPIKARGAALMDNGLRTGEASAVTKDMIIQIGHIVLVKVLFQEHEGKKSCDLKSKDSYRTIVLDEWGSW